MNQFSIAINGKPYFNTKNSQEVIHATGTREGINTSSILTKLIQEAGRWCENYASDLFWDWKEIEEVLCDRDVETCNYLFGFRRSGVDGQRAVLQQKNYLSYEYRSLWNLQIVCDDEDVDMWLWRVSI